jgi:hypothetical protein
VRISKSSRITSRTRFQLALSSPTTRLYTTPLPNWCNNHYLVNKPRYPIEGASPITTTNYLASYVPKRISFCGSRSQLNYNGYSA